MKKLLVVHNFYQNFGGEDSNIYEELEILGKEYEVEFLVFRMETKIFYFRF